MLTKIIGAAKLGKKTKKMSGGPQALKPMRPTKGSGIANGTMRQPQKARSYVVAKQNPAMSPGGGHMGLAHKIGNTVAANRSQVVGLAGRKKRG